MKRFNLIFACIWLIAGFFTTLNLKAENAPEVMPPDSCLLIAPQNLQVIGQTSNSVTLGWSSVPGATSYQVNAAINGVPTMAMFPAATNSYTYIFSTPFDFIDFKVRAVCINNTVGQWSALLRYDVVIVVDEVTQRPTPCTLPQNHLIRNNGNADIFAISPPNNGTILDFLHMEVKQGAEFKDFILWWSQDDNISSVRYQNVNFSQGITQDPDCPGAKCNSTQPLRFYDSNGDPLFNISPFTSPTGGGVNTTINYFQTVQVRFCIPSPGKDRDDDNSLTAPVAALQLESYPNPANESLTVSFTTDLSGPASLLLTDISGRLVRSLDQYEQLPAGQYQTEYTIADLNPGVYYLTLQTAQGRTTRLIMKQ